MKKVRTTLIAVLALLALVAVKVPTDLIAYPDVAAPAGNASNLCNGWRAFNSESRDVDSRLLAVAGDRVSVVAGAPMPIEEARHAGGSQSLFRGIKVNVGMANQPPVGLRVADGTWNRPTPVVTHETVDDLGDYDKGEK